MAVRSFIRFVSVLALWVGVAVSAPASGNQVWGMDASHTLERLRAGDASFLRHVSFTRHRFEEVSRLGVDASFAVGLHYQDLGLPDIAERLLLLSWETAPEPYRREALLELVRTYSADDRYDDLEQLALAARSRYPEDAEALAALVRSLYHLERYVEAAELAPLLHDRLRASRPPTNALRQEAALWRAVIAHRTGSADWPELFRMLFADYPAAEVHSRVWIYLFAREEARSAFGDGDLLLFTAKQLLAEGRAAEASDRFLMMNAADPWSPYGLLDFFRALSLSGRTGSGGAALAVLASSLPPDLARRAYEYAGRLFRGAAAHDEAIRHLESSLALQVSGPDEERVRWYWLSSRVRRNPQETAASIADLPPLIRSPGHFADIFAELAGRLAEAGSWSALRTAYDSLRPFATAGALSRYEIILARALETGLLPAPPAQAEEERVLLLSRAASQREDRFAALLASAILGVPGASVLGLPEADDDAVTVGPATAAGAPPVAQAADTPVAAALAVTYLRFGLLDRLRALVVERSAELDPSLLVVVADRLAAAGRYRESIGALNRFEANGGALSDEVARLRYPQAFAAIVEEVARSEGLDPALFYALIREESLYDPAIVSRAGAIGLAQLLPTTAEDIARRMRIADPVLADPADNLRIGGRYLGMLTSQFGSSARALAAYNGGQGNVRRWERSTAGLDEVLFHQAIPFPETYEHVRKVTVSASYLAYLYDGRDPTPLVRSVFALDR